MISTNNAHILVVDDDKEIRLLVSKFLEQHGHRVSGVQNGKEMWSYLKNAHIDLIILDLMLPGESGLNLCRDLRLREGEVIPIIMLTARGDDTDRIVGLEIGADDYITKPFNPRELLARINAVLRRFSVGKADGLIKNQKNTYRFLGWHLDAHRRELISPSKAVVDLSGAEFDLLLVFLENPHRVLTRDQLLELTRNRSAFSLDRTIDMQVHRLRRKIEREPSDIVLIKTVRGVGYIFTGEVVRE